MTTDKTEYRPRHAQNAISLSGSCFLCRERGIISAVSNNAGRNDPCPCGKMKPDGKPVKYKRCCIDKDQPMSPPIPESAIRKMLENVPPPEPFERGGFLTGRPFIDAIWPGKGRARAVGNTLHIRPATESFHQFLLITLSELLGKEWFEAEMAKPERSRHPLRQWFEEAQAVANQLPPPTPGQPFRGAEFTGNTRALLAIAYDFYSLKHCSAAPLPKLLNRLKDINQFQGARYEIAVGGLVVRAGFNIEWVNDKEKHCEFIGTHKKTGDKAAFEAKSHHRDGVLGRSGNFDPETAKIKIFDHIREALKQSPKDIPLVLFDDLNLPISEGNKTAEAEWFNEINKQLERANFHKDYKKTQYGALLITNFSWHFHGKIPPKENEVVGYFHTGSKFSLKPETILQYLKPAGQQYGFVPPRLEELKDISAEQVGS